jgi:UDP-2-acetamido-3-amino-2,3-dideoxy-glucuronate N-acetyltransferase
MTVEAVDGVRVHPRGLCESDDVGPGTRVCAFAHVLPGARIGRDCTIGDCAFVETGAVLGDRVAVRNGTLVFAGVTCEDDVSLGPNVLFTDDLRPRAHGRGGSAHVMSTVVGRGASIGAGAVVASGVTVGPYAFAAAGSVITKDVPAHAFVAGDPAGVKGWVCACGCRLDGLLQCPDCGTAHVRGEGGLTPVLGRDPAR